MNPDFVWNIIEECNWAMDGDYRRIRKFLIQNLSKSEGEALIEGVNSLRDALNRVVEAYGRDNFDHLNVGDDGYSDLLHHIIGLGKRSYERHMNNPRLVFERARRYDYEESFSYAIPYPSDY